MDNVAGFNNHLILTDEQKIKLSQELGIIIDGDLFGPRFDYVFKRIIPNSE
jgi:hypothetical protein